MKHKRKFLGMGMILTITFFIATNSFAMEPAEQQTKILSPQEQLQRLRNLQAQLEQLEHAQQQEQAIKQSEIKQEILEYQQLIDQIKQREPQRKQYPHLLREAQQDLEELELIKNQLLQQLEAQQSVQIKPQLKKQIKEPKQSEPYTIKKKKSRGTIHDKANNITYFIHKNKQDCINPGIYYHSKKRLEPISIQLKSNDGKEMIKNQLGNLSFSKAAQKKMNKPNDRFHNFPQCLEKNFGEWARVVIEEPINSINQLMNTKKEFTLIISIPGQIANTKGVFEFVVKKSLYEEEGLCTHRFFKADGICGAEKLGAQAKKKLT